MPPAARADRPHPPRPHAPTTHRTRAIRRLRRPASAGDGWTDEVREAFGGRDVDVLLDGVGG
ncbi:hypothetical protein, partial [Streptomyces sp. NPDC051098]|uniref:hypothetical protein n=1 Tax=Streptomyces sp. NPDC051098 TaxID=3155411 RepID=UPI0034350F7F